MTSKYKPLYTENITHHALFGIFISLCLMVFDFVVGCSFLAGSFVYLLPQIWFRYAFFSNQRLDKQITLNDVFKSMFGKMVLITLLFALCFSVLKVLDPLTVLLGYLTIICFKIICLFFPYGRTHRFKEF
jgi:F0F1-type ATP synthase assembly protein I